MSIIGGHVRVPDAQGGFGAFFSRPIGADVVPSVLVFQEIFGVNQHIREVCQRFAEAGFAALAPDVFHRSEPGVELGYDGPGVARGKELKAATTEVGFRSDLDASLKWLAARRDVRPDGARCVGFCFGGVLALLAATDPRVVASASFYGSGVPTLTLGGTHTVLDQIGDIRGRTVLFYGGLDSSIPSSDRDAVVAAFAAAGHVVPEVHVYEGANHGFFCDRRQAYDAASAADAWRATLRLFSEVGG